MTPEHLLREHEGSHQPRRKEQQADRNSALLHAHPSAHVCRHQERGHEESVGKVAPMQQLPQNSDGDSHKDGDGRLPPLSRWRPLERFRWRDPVGVVHPL